MELAEFIDEVASYLDDQGIGVFDADSGRNIFTGKLPSDPDNAVGIFAIPGAQIPRGSRDISSMHFPRFQVIVRNSGYDAASAKLAAIRAALHNKNGIELTSYRILVCHADQEGGPIGEDDQGRHEFSINFTARANAE